MELKDTVGLMISDDYRKRFVAEYWQTRIRMSKLLRTISCHYAVELPFALDCQVELLNKQYEAMRAYLEILKERAVIEGVDLEEKL